MTLSFKDTVVKCPGLPTTNPISAHIHLAISSSATLKWHTHLYTTRILCDTHLHGETHTLAVTNTHTFTLHAFSAIHTPSRWQTHPRGDKHTHIFTQHAFSATHTHIIGDKLTPLVTHTHLHGDIHWSSIFILTHTPFNARTFTCPNKLGFQIFKFLQITQLFEWAKWVLFPHVIRFEYLKFSRLFYSLF